MILGFMAVAQTSPLKMVNFHKLPNEIADLKALKDEAGRDSDYDGNKAALIRVKAQGFSEKTMLDFNTFPRPGIEIIHKKYKDGEMWLYVSSGCQGTIVIKYMGEYEFKLPSKLDAKGVYELVLGMETATLVIRTIPSEAEIFIDNQKVGTGYASKSVSIGVEHHYKVQCTDYWPKEGQVYFDQRDEKQIDVVLEANYGYITIKTEPDGADVFVDGKKVGVTPYMLEKISFGQHRVELQKAGYEKSVKVVVINPEELENTQLAKVVLVKDPNYKEQQVAVTMVAPVTPPNQNVPKSQSTQSTQSSQSSKSPSTAPTAAVATSNRTFTVNGVSFEMVAVKGGTFTMGCTSEQSDCDDDEKPAHSVTLSDYYIGKFEVTQKLWKAVMGSNPSNWKGDDLPVESVSWNDVQDFIRKLNQQTGQNFRLPTEAEWEYAARGGNKSKGYKYSGSNTFGNVAWYYDNSGSKTHQVGTKSPNELGIYDMSGNVWEWCQDLYGSYRSGSQTNPTGPSSGSNRMFRGGSWNGRAGYCRVSYRDNRGPGGRNVSIGFRLAISASTIVEKSTIKTAATTSSASGVFSVSPTKKVEFSKGNLQYQASTRTWRFAEHQWDYIGNDNKNISSNYNGWIDLFGWGTGNNPTKNSTNSSDYGSFNDWGNNTISNGGGKKWFTLTKDEWVYVFNTRSTNSGIRYAKATVNGVNGVILLPDNWSSSNYSLSNTNKSDASFSSNRISQSDWTLKLEANGAVFLPAAGFRYGTNVSYVGSDGFYWSATYSSSDSAYYVSFLDSELHPANVLYRKSGRSVRLVSLVE